MCSLGSKACLGQGSLDSRREHGGVRVVATSKAKEDGGCWDGRWGGSGSSEPTDILLPLCACRDLLTGAEVLILRTETPGMWPRVLSRPVGSPKKYCDGGGGRKLNEGLVGVSCLEPRVRFKHPS